MNLIRCGEVASVEADPAYFTGTVWQMPIHSAPEPARVNAAFVTFLPGGRTNWHTHPLGQTLHVVSGCGWFRTEGHAKVEIRAGDTLWIPPGERHWHGATDRTAMTHLAMQERFEGSPVEWQEAVGDEDYLAR
jgi:quercetin dioxygenase-like cupin family protein